MFGCSIYLIVALAHDRTDWYEKLAFIAIIVYWFIQNYKFIACVLVVVVSPIIILVIIIYVCFCNKS